MISANCRDIAASMAAIAFVIVLVTFLSNWTVPLSDCSTSDRISSSRRGFSTARGIIVVI
jgi:hypothetical protein